MFPINSIKVVKNNHHNCLNEIFTKKNTVADVEKAIEKFSEIIDWKDSLQKIEGCKKRIDEINKEAIYKTALSYMQKNTVYDLEKAIHYSSVTSAISVTRIGSRYSIPDLEEVMNYDELI